MTYNIHPIIVHFPIALLFLYSLIKIIPFAKWWPLVSWKHIERALLFVGVLGAIGALVTGPIANQLVQPDPELVTAHATFAFVSFLLYGSLLVLEIVSIFKPQYVKASNGVISKILAFLGLLAICLTGLLGGVMVYGLSADPLAPIVLKLLGIQI